jgi:hypothetical protein
MMVRSQEKCMADASTLKVYIHLDDLAEWAKDAESSQEFGQARLDFTYDDHYSKEDSTKTRVYWIAVTRPHAADVGHFENRGAAVCGCRLFGF